jgi:uncharacterized repeat protein (TIGR01451 family)
LGYNKSVSFNITIKKEDWKGYYYIPINFIEHNESRTIQLAYSDSIVLGVIQFSIIKSVDKNQIEIGDIITVSVNITNTGTICIKDVILSDILSFTSIEFSLIEGRLINDINFLQPDESAYYSYKIQAISQQIVEMKPSFIEYYYLMKIKEDSNQVEVKVIIPKTIQMFFIVIASSISIIVLGLYLNYAVKYKKRRYLTQRNELYLSKKGPRDSILKIDHTLIDRLNYLSRKDDKGGESF